MAVDVTPNAARAEAGAPTPRGLRANALNLGGGIAMALGSAGPTASIALTLAAITAANEAYDPDAPGAAPPARAAAPS
jgi:hypothetical protein